MADDRALVQEPAAEAFRSSLNIEALLVFGAQDLAEVYNLFVIGILDNKHPVILLGRRNNVKHRKHGGRPLTAARPECKMQVTGAKPHR